MSFHNGRHFLFFCWFSSWSRRSSRAGVRFFIDLLPIGIREIRRTHNARCISLALFDAGRCYCRDDLNTLYAEDDNAVAMSQDSRSLLIRRLTSIRGRAFRHSRVMQTNKMGPSRIYERRKDHRQHFLVVFLILYILRSIIPADTKVTGMSLWLNGLRSSSIQSVGVGYFLCGIRFLFGWTSSNRHSVACSSRHTCCCWK